MPIIGGGSVITGHPKYDLALQGGDSARGFYVNVEVLIGTAALRQGGLGVQVNRASDQPDTTWDGNPDVGANIRADNRSNQTIGGAVRGMKVDGRNRGTNINWVEGLNVGARNDSGKTVADYVKGLQVLVENYGNITSDAIGIDVVMLDENTTLGQTRTGIRIRNTDQSGMSAVNQAILLSHSSTNGFAALFKAAAATGDGVVASVATPAGNAAFAVIIDVAGVKHYIPAYTAVGFGG